MAKIIAHEYIINTASIYQTEPIYRFCGITIYLNQYRIGSKTLTTEMQSYAVTKMEQIAASLRNDINDGTL